MGRTHGSRKSRLFLPLVALLSSGTVLLGAGDAVRISSPAHKARVSGTIAVTAEVTTSARVAYVLLAVDGTRPASTNSLPATFQLDTRDLPDGPHALSAEAYTHRDRIAASKAITIYVDNQTVPRVVAKQENTSKTVTAASPPIAPRAVMLPPAVSSDRITTLLGAKRGPVPEPSLAGSLVTVASHGSNMAEAADAVLSHRMPMVVLNGDPLVGGVAPMVIGGQMRSGFRALFAATGARVDWLSQQRTARCVTDSLVVEVPIGSRMATVNGRHVDMGAVATIKNGRTVVPLRFFAQVTGSRVSWDARTRVASVQTPSRAIASAQASLTPAATTQIPVSDRMSARTPIYEAADRAP
jgi:hypothetical protein